MISRRSEFRLYKRGFKDCLLLIPGWAADYRIFEKLDLKFNYLVPIVLSTADFKERLLESIHKNSLDRVSIFSWSMGAFLAADFISEYPEKAGKHVFFVSAKKQYNAEAINTVKEYLKKNRRGYLYKFYDECFSEGEKESFSEFKRRLLKSYISTMTSEALLEGLDYLSSASFVLRDPGKSNAIFIHGSCDRIAPIEEALQLKSEFAQSEFIAIEKAGHLPFLSHDFNSIINRYVDR